MGLASGGHILGLNVGGDSINLLEGWRRGTERGGREVENWGGWEGEAGPVEAETKEIPHAVPSKTTQYLPRHQTRPTAQAFPELILPEPRTKPHFNGFLKDVLEILRASKF